MVDTKLTFCHMCFRDLGKEDDIIVLSSFLIVCNDYNEELKEMDSDD